MCPTEQSHKDELLMSCSFPSNGGLFLVGSQDAATVFSQSPNREDVPVLGVTDHAVFVEDSHDLLLREFPVL